MAEVFCDRLNLDPLGDRKASAVRFRDLGAAFPSEGVEAEAERMLRAHVGVMEKVDDTFITAIMRNHEDVKGPERLADGPRSPGGLLFGQLVPRFDNRIISRCPLTFQHVHDRVLAETKDEERANHEAEKLAKVPSADCPEFYRFRCAMQLANVQVATGNGRQTRGPSVEQRKTLHAAMEQHRALTPTEFKKAVRALTAGAKDNVDQMLALPDADKSLVLDPAQKRTAADVLAVLWPHLDEATHRHALTNLRRGKAVTARAPTQPRMSGFGAP